MAPKPEFVENTNDENTAITFNIFKGNGDNTIRQLACEEFQYFLQNWKHVLSPEDLRKLLKLSFQGGDLRYKKM